jgi:uncharacterized surface protein with fasciclin (FAS1) repeats
MKYWIDMNSFKYFWLVILLLVLCISCKEEEGLLLFEPTGTSYISDFLDENSGRFSNYLMIAKETGMYASLKAMNQSGNNLFTLFAPTDSAFELFFSESEDFNSIEELLANKDYATLLGRYHLLMAGINSFDFPYGVISDTTATGEQLSIGIGVNPISQESDFIVNNTARIIEKDIELTNGFIQIIDLVLKPLTFSSYEWLLRNPKNSIFTELISITGLDGRMGIYDDEDTSGNVNRYTLLVESNGLYERYGINNLEDLIDSIGPENDNYTDADNAVYRYAAYHILEGNHFSNEFTNDLYNTFTDLPVQVIVGGDIQINPGVFGDNTYVPMILEQSNIISKNGPIHFIDSLLFLFRPKTANIDLKFYNDPVIRELSSTEGEFELDDPEALPMISWTGARYLYYNNISGNTDVVNSDYLNITGPFTITYITDKIFTGVYDFKLKVGNRNGNYAIIQAYIDDIPVGSTVDLTANHSSAPYALISIGRVSFDTYDSHKITIEAVVPGDFYWDYTRFTPISN